MVKSEWCPLRVSSMTININMNMNMTDPTHLHNFFTTIVYGCFQFLNGHSEVLRCDRTETEVQVILL